VGAISSLVFESAAAGTAALRGSGEREDGSQSCGFSVISASWWQKHRFACFCEIRAARQRRALPLGRGSAIETTLFIHDIYQYHASGDLDVAAAGTAALRGWCLNLLLLM
jgi:hypothetical protein